MYAERSHRKMSEILRRRVISCLLGEGMKNLSRSPDGKGFVVLHPESIVLSALEGYHNKPMKGAVVIRLMGFGHKEVDEAIHYRSMLQLHGFEAEILSLPMPGKSKIIYYVRVSQYIHVYRR